MTDKSTFNALGDRQAIADLIYRYCRSVDRLDIPLGHSIWHDDATADYGADIYQGNGRGAIDHICAQHRRTLHHSHQVSNILVDLHGDRAGSEAYVTAILRVQRNAQLMQMTIWGRYVDRWSRRDGRWGLDHRLALRDFDEIREVTPLHQHDAAQNKRLTVHFAAGEEQQDMELALRSIADGSIDIQPWLSERIGLGAVAHAVAHMSGPLAPIRNVIDPRLS